MINSSITKIVLPVSFVSLGAVSCQKSAVQTERPNVVIIYLDDMDNNMAGCYGGYCNTPNIDRIAENGVRFDRFYPSSAVSQPSRYTLLTGKYASRNMSPAFKRDSQKDNQAFVRWNTDIVAEDLTIAEVMKQAGYHTGFVGKWHLGFPNYNPTALAGDADPNNEDVKKFLSDNYKETLKHVKEVSGFDEVINLYSINIRWIPVPDTLDRHNQHWVTEGAVQFLESAAKKDKPFLLYMATTLPHLPNVLKSLEGATGTPLGYAQESDIQPSRASILAEANSQQTLNSQQKNDYAAMKWIDDGVGVVMNKIREMGLEENTIIILASDNDNRAKMSCYDGKVPFIMQWKGHITPQTVCDELVSNIDFVPTIYDLCNISAPAESVIDGKSMRQLLEGDNENWRESLFLEVLYTRGVVTKTHNYVAVRFPQSVMDKITPENRREYNQEGTKISQNDGVTQEELTGEHVRYGTNVSYPSYYEYDQLFDLTSDPAEQKNLAYDKNHEGTLLKMKKLLKGYSQDLPNSFGEFK